MDKELLISYLKHTQENLDRLCNGELANIIIRAEQNEPINAEQLEAIKMDIETEVNRMGRAVALIDGKRVE